jgi:hypothetical protein
MSNVRFAPRKLAAVVAMSISLRLEFAGALYHAIPFDSIGIDNSFGGKLSSTG